MTRARATRRYIETERVLREHRRALVILDSPQCLMYLLPCCDLANELCPDEDVAEDGRLLAVTFHSKGTAVSEAAVGAAAAAHVGSYSHSTPHPLLSPAVAGAAPPHHLGPAVRPLAEPLSLPRMCLPRQRGPGSASAALRVARRGTVAGDAV
jgi:hypothetical protein